jgi:hypothetical protein
MPARTLSRADRIERILRFIDTEAWTEAALALVELEQPNWKLRRLAFEDGVWFCSLSRCPELPAELDDPADACDEVLPLAILKACAEVRDRTEARSRNGSLRVPRVQPAKANPICCDNFA